MYSFEAYKESSVAGRYISLDTLKKSWVNTLYSSQTETLGTSVNGNDIFSISLGTGPRKVLMWSQMHGNESTTTKAVLDLVNYLRSEEDFAAQILNCCTICIVPILNPDGAEAYTRVNANQVDLNRDAKNRTQPESVVLRKLFERFRPDFCFNLHDQRTLFSAGPTAKPATISFLSPSNDPARGLNPTRITAMQLIVAMNTMLQEHIPGQVGRYDDKFNENCVGDTFQMLGVPTVLFEAGHYPNDYQREETRKYIFMALVTALDTISLDRVNKMPYKEYFAIPENKKLFFDVLVKNAHKVNDAYPENHLLGIRFKETLKNAKIEFVPEIVEMGELPGAYGHLTLDCATPENLKGTAYGNLLELIQDFHN